MIGKILCVSMYRKTSIEIPLYYLYGENYYTPLVNFCQIFCALAYVLNKSIHTEELYARFIEYRSARTDADIKKRSALSRRIHAETALTGVKVPGITEYAFKLRRLPRETAHFYGEVKRKKLRILRRTVWKC